MFLSGRRGIKQCGALLGVAETGVAPTPTSKNPSTAKNQNKKYLLYSLSRRRRHTCSAYVSIPPCLGDADTHAPRMCQFPPCLGDANTHASHMC